ncbi:hypothetical protein Scep_025356 [Stephania cephalantha]|uniref:Uncharacterized protein n=1 Tax=Stephania cephalantha TaxID=152367 RepID=A0AAP0ENC1_9MAGN
MEVGGTTKPSRDFWDDVLAICEETQRNCFRIMHLVDRTTLQFYTRLHRLQWPRLYSYAYCMQFRHSQLWLLYK